MIRARTGPFAPHLLLVRFRCLPQTPLDWVGKGGRELRSASSGHHERRGSRRRTEGGSHIGGEAMRRLSGGTGIRDKRSTTLLTASFRFLCHLAIREAEVGGLSVRPAKPLPKVRRVSKHAMPRIEARIEACRGIVLSGCAASITPAPGNLAAPTRSHTQLNGSYFELDAFSNRDHHHLTEATVEGVPISERSSRRFSLQ